jgi:hypothetical protein
VFLSTLSHGIAKKILENTRRKNGPPVEADRTPTATLGEVRVVVTGDDNTVAVIGQQVSLNGEASIRIGRESSVPDE